MKPAVILSLAWQNIRGTGIRLWINVTVIAISMIVILWAKGIYAGLTMKMLDAVIATEVGAGQIIARNFDIDDPLSYEKGRETITPEMMASIRGGNSVPVLFRSGTLYFRGRSLPVTIKGIRSDQTILTIPTTAIAEGNGNPTVILGTRMLKALKAKKGDILTLKWRDAKGSFDAADFSVGAVMSTRNPRVDDSSAWISWDKMAEMMATPSQASYIVAGNPEVLKRISDTLKSEKAEGQPWKSRSAAHLTDWIRKLIEADEKNFRFIFGLLIFLCSVGIFNAQIVSVFKRRSEIGTLMALGMRKGEVTSLFAMEGILTALIAIAITPLLGAPLFWWSANRGFSSGYAEGTGMPLPERIVAHYDLQTVLTMMGVVFAIMALVSWFPVRKISSTNPAMAISGRGKE
ncbi:MAG: hypothetical protein CVV64_16050 [Candidatus Wallbacteria bacterium HGW-Wallbacteria-1]|jgi:ABC-type lipoprotein release transport system permease subunit|uniref:ABC3 transporter permease C-terminal domain-containing protein n=1 Tax=Candidatus Wallbacteria bacterium HGW-Wallbacteria-1 TaxID=2013854 RepID=A0A2N1PL56_9BACT|nr:MAG: hypothetical protein CVV64_16050 [Candidatus Wallbacteria bacterium HGW-Wallbacteria-1]